LEELRRENERLMGELAISAAQTDAVRDEVYIASQLQRYSLSPPTTTTTTTTKLVESGANKRDTAGSVARADVGSGGGGCARRAERRVSSVDA
jgi:hypothetical protein